MVGQPGPTRDYSRIHVEGADEALRGPVVARPWDSMVREETDGVTTAVGSCTNPINTLCIN